MFISSTKVNCISHTTGWTPHRECKDDGHLLCIILYWKSIRMFGFKHHAMDVYLTLVWAGNWGKSSTFLLQNIQFWTHHRECSCLNAQWMGGLPQPRELCVTRNPISFDTKFWAPWGNLTHSLSSVWKRVCGKCSSQSYLSVAVTHQLTRHLHG